MGEGDIRQAPVKNEEFPMKKESSGVYFRSRRVVIWDGVGSEPLKGC